MRLLRLKRGSIKQLTDSKPPSEKRLALQTLSSLLRGYLLPTGIVLLFLGLWVKSQAVNVYQHDRYRGALRQMQELDERLNQYILQVRLGLLSYYDPIVDGLEDFKQIQTTVQQPPAFIDSASQQKLYFLLQDHIRTWQDKEQLIQQFQSQNATLNNSLAYFPIAIADLVAQEATDPATDIRLNALLQNVLLFNLSTRDDLKPQIESQIQQILSTSPTAQSADLKAAIAHAEIILTSRPQVDRLVKAMMDLPTNDRSEELIQTYDRAYQQALNTANLYRFWLYLLSTLLVIAVAALIISKLRASAMAVQQSETRLRNIFDNTQVGIFRARLMDGLILDANQCFVSMLGYDAAEQVVGVEKLNRFYAKPDIAQQMLERIHDTQEIHSFETQLRKRNGMLQWVLLSARLNLAENCLEGVIADISDRKRTEAALQKAMEAAQVASLAKSQFLSHMSHELRTPLNVVLGFTQLMSRTRPLSIKQQDYLNMISRSGEHLLTLINDVLELSKLEAGRTTLSSNDFDLSALLDDLYQMFQFKAEMKGLQLHFEKAIDLPHHIHTDERKLRQVLMNLLSNAVKFTEEGSVVLRVDAGGGMWHVGEKPAYALHFEVEDTGPGIAPDELDYLFEPFMQTEAGRRSQEGTGLGLPISYKFVQLMGGDITVESRPEAGSIFRFTVQAYRVQGSNKQGPLCHRQVIGLEDGQSTYRILVVEDKLENRQLLTELLQPIGFQVKSGANGQEAIDLWLQWSPHLIWMDLQMPILDGYEATKQIKAIGQNTPVIIALTGSVFEEERAVALAAGCDDFVRKPFRTEMIFEKMAEYLGVRYMYTEIYAPKDEICE